jgi:hypothetical protein
MKNIVDWAQSKYGFYVDRQYINGKWVLQPGPIRLAPHHARILSHCFTPDSNGRLPYDVIGWGESAKSGKSTIAGLGAKYTALHIDSNSTITMASNKQNQAASIMFKSLTDSIDLNPYLPNVAPGRFEASFKNGNVVRAIASNSRGEAGARFTLALFDEPWGYVYTDAERLWTEYQTDPTRLNSVKLAIGYAGYLESVLWLELLESGLQGEPVPELIDIVNQNDEPACWVNGRTFVFWSDVCRQPWQTEEWTESQRKTLRPNEFARMIECRFVEGEGNFIEEDAWQSLIGADHEPLPPGDRSKPVYVGLDIATAPGGDDCALIGIYAEDNIAKVAFHKVWKGKDRKQKLKLTQTVKPYLLKVQQDYRLVGIWFDPFQALQLAEELRMAGINCREVPQTHSTRAPKDTALLEIASNRQLMLYDDNELRHAASGANAKELGNGLIFLKKASGRSKIDLLIALSNVADEPIYKKPAEIQFYAQNPFYDGSKFQSQDTGYIEGFSKG